MKQSVAAFLAALQDPSPGWLVAFGSFLVTLTIGMWWFALISDSLPW